MDSVPEISPLHGDAELSGRCPRSTEKFITPWQAATLAAFGTTEVIDCLLLRSFDGGLQQLANETTKLWKERTDRVRAFDAAEQVLFALLATEQISATGCLPRQSPSGSRMMHESSKCPELIPSHIFRIGGLAFGPSGELKERISMLDAICNGAKWNGRLGDASIPRYYEVRIRTADFIAVTTTQQVLRTMTNQVDVDTGTRKYTDGTDAAQNSPPRRTGTAGRPKKSTDLLIPEMRRRALDGLLCPRKMDESRALILWLEANHPGAMAPKPKSLCNSISDEYKRLASELSRARLVGKERI